MKRIAQIIFVTLICLYNTVLAQTAVTNKLNIFLKKEIEVIGIPGVAVAVLKDNKVLFLKSYGYANLDHSVPVTNQTIFPLASVDKQIIATCIMMLYEQGRLNLEDPVSKYLDSVPSSWNNMQIKQLLTHTSGLPDEPLESRNGKGYDKYSSEDIYRHIIKQDLIHPTNERFLYSDAGYFLLQQIFEKASGQYYPHFITERIFKPLAMSQTGILNPTEIVRGRSVSYYRNSEAKLLINNFRQISVGPHFGDIGTTIEDFIKYEQAITENRLLKKETYQLMWTPATVKGNRQVSQFQDEADLFDANASYGFGWELDSFHGYRAVYHSGFTGNSITRFPDHGVTVLLLTNLTYRPIFNPNALARKIAYYYLPQPKLPIGKMGKINSIGPEKLLEQLLLDKPESSLFETSYYQRLLPASLNYKRTINRYGKMQTIKQLQTFKEGEKIVETFEVAYQNGKLLYEVTRNAGNQIMYITVKK
jgi:CubicO group peptidase (beta-lactamase class C family)